MIKNECLFMNNAILTNGKFSNAFDIFFSAPISVHNQSATILTLAISSTIY